MCGEQLDTDNQQNQVNSQNISNESVPVQNTNNTQLEGQNINQSIEKGEEKNSKNKNIPIIIVISLLVLISLVVLFIRLLLLLHNANVVPKITILYLGKQQ